MRNKHLQALSALVTIITSIASVYIAVQMKKVTDYQTEIAKSERVPFLTLNLKNTKTEPYPRELRRAELANNGGPLRHFSYNFVSALVLKRSIHAGKEGDIGFLLVPVWNSVKKEVANSGSETLLKLDFIDGLENKYQKLTFQLPPGKGFHRYNYIKIEHFLVVSYETMLKEKETRYFEFDTDDFVEISEEEGKRVLKICSNPVIDFQNDNNTAIYAAADKFENIETVRVVAHGEENLHPASKHYY